MNILIILALAVSGVLLLWLVQSITLVLAGEPLAWPLRFETRKPAVKLVSRLMVHLIWIIIIVGTPLALGIAPMEWLDQQFTTPVPWRDIAIAISIVLFPIWIVYALWFAVGWISFELRQDKRTRRLKLLRRFIGPWPLATLEEAVFRGVLLEQLLRSLPQSQAYSAIAIVLTSAVFSSLHFVKQDHFDKRFWQRAYGLFIISCFFGLAYVVGGRSLWLPIAVHGAAVFAIEVMRVYVVFHGPPCLLGYAEFPQAGLFGSIYVLGAAIALVLLI